MQLPKCILMSVLLMIADGLIVHGPSGPLVVPLGTSVVLPCYIDEPLPIQGLEVMWTRPDLNLVHLYQDGASRAESQQHDYHDRAHFFTDQIQHGNFSLCLENVRREDKGEYKCKVYSQQDSGETAVEIKDVERLLVSGSDESISASVGEDVTLNCSVDSHITPQHIEEVSWKKTDKEEDTLVLLYQNNETLSDSADERYRDRVEFFSDEIPKGNFSLRLKSVRTEDKGVYMCQVFAGGLSANATAILGQMGSSFSHIMVLILCIMASASALLLFIIIYCRSENTDPTAIKHARTFGFLHVFLPNIVMFVAFVLWGVTEGFLYETISCCALYILRPLMLIYVAPTLKHMSESCLHAECVIFMVVHFLGFFHRAQENMVRYAEIDKAIIIVILGVVILLCVIYIIYLGLLAKNKEMPCCGQICKWIWDKSADVAVFSFFILPSLQVTLLYVAFGTAKGGFFFAIIFPIFYYLSLPCLSDKNREKKLKNILLCGAGWTCTAVFVQVLWMITMYIKKNKDLDLTVTFKKMLYVFGSVVVVLLNTAALMTELILKTANGERAVGDLRVIIFFFESIFAFSLLILLMFGPWISEMKCLQCCQRGMRTNDFPVTGFNQNQDSQNAAEFHESPASGSNQRQKTAESYEINPLLKPEEIPPDSAESQT